MKKTLSICLMVLLLLPACTRVALCMRFRWQQERIAATLCEKRSRPALQCRGACYLRRQMQKIEAATSGRATEERILVPMGLWYYLPATIEYGTCCTAAGYCPGEPVVPAVCAGYAPAPVRPPSVS